MSRLLIFGAAVALAASGQSVFAQQCGAPAIQPRMGEPVSGLSQAELERFNAGAVAFGAPLSIAEGLGPIFNDVGCGSCHSQPTLGGFSSFAVTRYGVAASGGNPFDPLAGLGGPLLQLQAIDPICQEIVPPGADVVIQRLTPGTNGIGLVGALLDADILARETNPPAGVSGISKTVQPVEGGPMRVARYGWKADVATTMTFSADAALNEMGLTSTFFPVDNAPNGDTVLRDLCDTVADPEDLPDGMGFTKVDRFTDFQRFLAQPPQTPKTGMAGEALFDSIGCAACHVSSAYTTGVVAEAALSGIDIKPYSDFLLHDMGSLGDGIVSGLATETEMMTRTLWGLRFRSSMLHDGRATGGTFNDNVRSTISSHDGEALASSVAFAGLTTVEQDQVVSFLESMGQSEFDWEGDNDVDEFDWFFLEPELTGPVGALTPDDLASVADIDVDGDFDLVDFAALQRAFSGTL